MHTLSIALHYRSLFLALAAVVGLNAFVLSTAQAQRTPAANERSATAMTIAAAFLREFEGLSITVYVDLAGKRTHGYGHNVDGFACGEEIERDAEASTLELIEQTFACDVSEAHKAVSRHLTVTLNENQIASLVSLCFSLGETRFAQSDLLEAVNAGEFMRAADLFGAYVKYKNAKTGQHEVSRGLQRRRAAERDLFLKQPARSD